MADARQPRGNLFQYTLKGVEELDHFPTDEAQERALNEIGHEVRVRDLSLGILILAAIVFITTACTRQLIHLLIPGMLGSADKDVSLILGVMAGIAVMRWLHRWGAARDLRRKLLDCGVPVCVPCAYLLQGLPSETVACPECGMPIPIEVRTLKRRHLPTIQTATRKTEGHLEGGLQRWSHDQYSRSTTACVNKFIKHRRQDRC